MDTLHRLAGRKPTDGLAVRTEELREATDDVFHVWILVGLRILLFEYVEQVA
ncbi:MAG: hypothetical protein RBS17_07945 [Coriobacteriia bacterium]|nr:hypothetical protein [Coriobacteriia bacterium]